MFKFHKDSLAQTMITGGDRVNDLTGFRYTLLDNLPLIRGREDNIKLSVTHAESKQFYGDFYGLLGYLNVPVELHWITTRLNNFMCSTDYNSELLEITVPSLAEINRIKTIYLSSS